MDKISIIKICAIIIAMSVLFTILTNIYYDLRYTIRNHNERKLVCDANGLAYFETIQTSKELVRCCEIEDGKISYCEEFIIK